MASTMFQPDGIPIRAKVVVHGAWEFDVSFTPGPGGDAKGNIVVAHELTHVVQNRTQVHVRHFVPAGRRAVPTGTQLLPEVGDEVLVSFQCAVPRSTALYFNPKELSVRKTNPPAVRTVNRGNQGLVRDGRYRLVVLKKGVQPLVLGFAAAGDRELTEDTQTFRIG